MLARSAVESQSDPRPRMSQPYLITRFTAGYNLESNSVLTRTYKGTEINQRFK